MRDPNPRVILIPGLGMIAVWKNKSESRVTAEFYLAAIGVIRGAESLGTYTAISRKEAFDIEYWALEEAKLQRMPPEAELARQVVVEIGRASCRGRVGRAGGDASVSKLCTAATRLATHPRDIGIASTG